MAGPTIGEATTTSTDSGSSNSEAPRALKKEAIIATVVAKPEFQRFWSAYDLKKGRDEAAKSWSKIDPDQHLAETIIAAARGYAEDNPDKAYRKHPSTWLNQKGWLDERVPKGGKGGGQRKSGGQEWRDRNNGWNQPPIDVPILNDIPFDET